MFTDGYQVIIEDFTKRHFVHSFERKYKGKQWEITLKAIKEMLSRYDNLAPNHVSTTSKLDIICPCNGSIIIKLDFAIAGSNISAKSSGNRVIAAVNQQQRVVRILLIYSKNDISPPSETSKWKKVISQNYPDFHELK
ncbi:MAG: hypothetical protein WCT01_00440 [Candidatus Shapirobacteria bacterium]